MLIKDLETGSVREYGKDCHDSLAISQDGRSLSYYNLQCGEGSKYGCFRFVMEDGKVPDDSQTPDAIYAECYFNIGGFPDAKKIRADVFKELEEAMYHEAFEVSHEEDGLQKWDGGNWIRYKLFERVMKQLKEQSNE